MSSREIAELTGKQHTHVIRDIRATIDELGDGTNLSHLKEIKDSKGYTALFHLPKDLTLTLITGYDVKRRHAIKVRWLELEEKAAKPAIDPMMALKDPAAMRGLLFLGETALRSRCVYPPGQIGSGTIEFSLLA